MPGQSGQLPVPPRVENVVIETLCDEDEIGEAEVNGEGDYRGHEPGPDRAGKVCNVSDEPDREEEKRDAFSGALLVVLDQLGDLRDICECLHFVMQARRGFRCQVPGERSMRPMI